MGKASIKLSLDHLRSFGLGQENIAGLLEFYPHQAGHFAPPASPPLGLTVVLGFITLENDCKNASIHIPAANSYFLIRILKRRTYRRKKQEH